MTQPHALFNVWSPDEVAECLEGVSTELYSKIWNEIVPLYDGQPRSEVPDDFSERSLSKYWDKLSEEEKIELNKLAEEAEGDDSVERSRT